MARALWTGSLSFGLVNVPVQLLSAVRDLDLHFRQLHEKDKSPIETQRWCSEEEKEVPFDAITRSYELESGKVVLFDAHSIRSEVPLLFDGRLPDLNIGTAGGASFGATGARVPAGAAHTLTFAAPVAFAGSLTTDPLVNAVVCCCSAAPLVRKRTSTSSTCTPPLEGYIKKLKVPAVVVRVRVPRPVAASA